MIFKTQKQVADWIVETFGIVSIDETYSSNKNAIKIVTVIGGELYVWKNSIHETSIYVGIRSAMSGAIQVGKTRIGQKNTNTDELHSSVFELINLCNRKVREDRLKKLEQEQRDKLKLFFQGQRGVSNVHLMWSFFEQHYHVEFDYTVRNLSIKQNILKITRSAVSVKIGNCPFVKDLTLLVEIQKEIFEIVTPTSSQLLFYNIITPLTSRSHKYD